MRTKQALLPPSSIKFNEPFWPNVTTYESNLFTSQTSFLFRGMGGFLLKQACMNFLSCVCSAILSGDPDSFLIKHAK